MLKLAETGHPNFECTSPLSRGTCENIGGEKRSSHHNAEHQTAELLLEDNHCRELVQYLRSIGKMVPQ